MATNWALRKWFRNRKTTKKPIRNRYRSSGRSFVATCRQMKVVLSAPDSGTDEIKLRPIFIIYLDWSIFYHVLIGFRLALINRGPMNGFHHISQLEQFPSYLNRGLMKKFLRRGKSRCSSCTSLYEFHSTASSSCTPTTKKYADLAWHPSTCVNRLRFQKFPRPFENFSNSDWASQRCVCGKQACF